MSRPSYDPRFGRLSDAEAALVVALRRVIVEAVHDARHQGDGEDAEQQLVAGLRGMIADATEDARRDAYDDGRVA